MVSGRPISSPVPRHPDPPPVSLGPMTGNPIRPRVGAGDIAAGHPHPAVPVPAPVAGLPNHRGAGRRRDRLLLRRRRSSRPAISLTGISRRRSTRITWRLTGIGIGGGHIVVQPPAVSRPPGPRWQLSRRRGGAGRQRQVGRTSLEFPLTWLVGPWRVGGRVRCTGSRLGVPRTTRYLRLWSRRLLLASLRPASGTALVGLVRVVM